MSPGIVAESDMQGNLTSEYVFFSGVAADLQKPWEHGRPVGIRFVLSLQAQGHAGPSKGVFGHLDPKGG